MPETSHDWLSELAFSDRLAAISAISSAYLTANPDCAASSVKSYAKAEELNARQHASSLCEYLELCARAAQLLQASATPAEDVVNQHSDEHVFLDLSEHDARIGTFAQARHHRDGLFSEIYKAKDSDHDGRLVALKVTNPAMMTAPHDSIREARILASFKDTPNIIPLLQAFKQPQGRFVLVFPFMLHDLGSLLANDALPPLSQKIVLHDVFTGLACIHAQGVIHRDIKPSNILLASPQGPAYLADFGISWSAYDQDSEPAEQKILQVGTTCYRAPELLFGGQAYGPALDMWAAGCVAAQILCLGRESLFDAGELGSELALIKSIFETLGTPQLDAWPEAATLPDWGKMNFVRYAKRSWADILATCDSMGRSLVADLVIYESSNRSSAATALQHSYFKS